MPGEAFTRQVKRARARLPASSNRSHQLTFPSFKRQVLDELNADLALALLVDEKYNSQSDLAVRQVSLDYSSF